MGAILEQLGLDQTFFVELGIFALLFFILANVYFKPFLKLFEARHKRTVEDRESATKLMAEAQAKLEEYRNRLTDERVRVRSDYERLVNDAKKDEADILSKAREEAKKITHAAAEDVSRQKAELTKQLSGDVEALAKSISENLLSRKD